MNTQNGTFVQKFRITAEKDGKQSFLSESTRWATIDKAVRFAKNGYTIAAIDSWQKVDDGEGYAQDFGTLNEVKMSSMELFAIRMGGKQAKAIDLESAEIVANLAGVVKELGRQASKGATDPSLVTQLPSNFFSACKALGIEGPVLVQALLAEYPEAGGQPRQSRRHEESPA